MHSDVSIHGGIDGCPRDMIAITRLYGNVWITARTSR